MSVRIPAWRRLALGFACLVLTGGTIAAAGVSAATSYAASLGSHGSARWTPGTSVHVNLRAMTPGTWKQQLWSGTCALPGRRLVVLPGLVVPATGVLARTTSSISSNVAVSAGVTLRLLFGSTVVCGAFVKPAGPSGSPSPTPNPAGSAMGA